MSYAIPGQMPLEEHDPVLYDLIEKEKHRQWSGLELIASENFTSKVNKYKYISIY